MSEYRIEMTPDRQHPCEQCSYRTLAEARAALRRANGGRLYGKFYVPDTTAVEGWNLGRNEGCDTAAITRKQL